MSYTPSKKAVLFLRRILLNAGPTEHHPGPAVVYDRDWPELAECKNQRLATPERKIVITSVYAQNRLCARVTQRGEAVLFEADAAEHQRRTP